jgi:hypothetical protein
MDHGQNRNRQQAGFSSSRRVWLRGGLAIAAIALFGMSLARPAQAETPPALAKFAGNYKYAGTREQGIAIIDKALDEGLADLNMVMRLLVKKAIESRFAETVLIEVPGHDISIKLGEFPKVTVENGKTETRKDEDGKTGKVTHAFDGSKITETLAGDEGTITNVFDLSADGKTLHRNVTFSGGRWKKPVSYKLDYTRK